MLPCSYAEWSGVSVGCFRFGDLSERLAAPRIGRHYISLTLGAAVEVEGILDDHRHQARVAPGQLMFMAAGQSNEWRWDGPTEEAQLFVDPDVIEQAANDSGYGQVALRSQIAVEDPSISQIVLALVDELRSPGPSPAMMAQSAVQYLALHLLRRHCTWRADLLRAGTLNGQQISRIERFADAHMQSDISLADLAAVVHMSQFHFARAFKLTTGQSPHRWLTARRIARAQELLRATALPIVEVAAETGFQSQSHFGQVFRRWSGHSPRQWRNLARC